MSRKFIAAAMTATTMSIALGVGAASAGAASAQTAFQAVVQSHGNADALSCAQTAQPPPPPPNEPPYSLLHLFCAPVSIAGYGSGVWTLNLFAINSASSKPQCTGYTAVSTLALNDGTGTLVVDETGAVCSGGGSGTAPRIGQPFGAPWPFITADWQVDPTVTGPNASTGVFAGATGGGTETGHFDATESKLTYTGTL